MALTKKRMSKNKKTKRTKYKTRLNKNKTFKNRRRNGGGIFSNFKNRIGKFRNKQMPIIEGDNERSSFDNNAIRDLENKIKYYNNYLIQLNLMKNIIETELDEFQEKYDDAVENNFFGKRETMINLENELKTKEYKQKNIMLEIEKNKNELEKAKRQIDRINQY